MPVSTSQRSAPQPARSLPGRCRPRPVRPQRLPGTPSTRGPLLITGVYGPECELDAAAQMRWEYIDDDVNKSIDVAQNPTESRPSPRLRTRTLAQSDLPRLHVRPRSRPGDVGGVAWRRRAGLGYRAPQPTTGDGCLRRVRPALHAGRLLRAWQKASSAGYSLMHLRRANPRLTGAGGPRPSRPSGRHERNSTGVAGTVPRRPLVRRRVSLPIHAVSFATLAGGRASPMLRVRLINGHWATLHGVLTELGMTGRRERHHRSDQP